MDIVVVSRLKSKTCFPLSTDVTNQFYVLLLLDVGFLISATALAPMCPLPHLKKKHRNVWNNN